VAAQARPSPAWGLRRALILWKLVLAVWVMPSLLLLPASLISAAALSDRLACLPDDGGAPGDLVLIMLDLVLDLGMTVGFAVVAGAGLSWLWNVVWHAGTVRWQQWAAGPPPRLAEVLGHGLLAFWPYLRLAAVALLATGASLTLLWVPLSTAISSSNQAMADDRIVVLAFAGAAMTVILTVVLWTVSLRAAWLLGMPGRRAALAAWLRALSGTARFPVSSVGTVLLWALSALGLGLLALFAGPHLEPVSASVLSQATAVLRAFCWVGLFCSFAPTTGLWPTSDAEPPPA